MVAVSTTGPEVDTVEVDLEGNHATATLRAELSIDDLFDDQGELRLWEDDTGWNGYTIEQDGDGEVAYYYVNTVHGDEWTSKVRVGEQAVTEAIKSHIEDPRAGGVGAFQRRCTPP